MLCWILTGFFYIYRGISWYDEQKFIVCQDNLLQLLKPCIRCGMEALVEQQQAYGCYVPFKISCQSDKCGHVREWANSEKVNGVPILNLLLCATILFTGCLPTKFLRAFNFLNVSTVSPGTFFKYQREYLHGVSQVSKKSCCYDPLCYVLWGGLRWNGINHSEYGDVLHSLSTKAADKFDFVYNGSKSIRQFYKVSQIHHLNAKLCFMVLIYYLFWVFSLWILSNLSSQK